MKLLVTGANGFIGTGVIDELAKKNEFQVVALVRRNSKWDNLKEKSNISVIEVDYQGSDLENEFMDVNVCIHLIGQMGKYGVSKEDYVYTNVNLTKKILEMCKRNNVKQFIFCSTPGVQGLGIRLAKEDQPYAPRNMYEETKVMAEKEIINFCTNSSIKYTIIRPDFVYGPGDTRRIKMYKGIKDGKFVLTTNGRSFLHPTYISDVAQGFIRSIGNTNAYNQIFNISAREDMTSLEYLKVIANSVGSKLIQINIGYFTSMIAALAIESFYRIVLKKEAFVTRSKIDFLAIDHSTSSDKAMRILGYYPQVGLTEGMQRTIEWCQNQRLLD